MEMSRLGKLSYFILRYLSTGIFYLMFCFLAPQTVSPHRVCILKINLIAVLVVTDVGHNMTLLEVFQVSIPTPDIEVQMERVEQSNFVSTLNFQDCWFKQQNWEAIKETEFWRQNLLCI